MRAVAVGRQRHASVGDDLRRAGDGIPEPHALTDVATVGLPRVAVHDPRALARVEVEGRRVGDEREALLGRLERGEDAALGGAEPDDPRVGVGGGERQEEVGVDRELRAHRPKERQHRLPHHLARAAGRRDQEADAGRARIDPRDVLPHRAWHRRGDVDQRDADKRRRPVRVGEAAARADEPGDGEQGEPASHARVTWGRAGRNCRRRSAPVGPRTYRFPSAPRAARCRWRDASRAGKNDESVPNSRRCGPATASADSNTCSSVRPGW